MITQRTVPATPIAAAAGLTRILVQRIRMAMREPAYAYNVYVREAEVPPHAAANLTYFTILSTHGSNERWVDFADATRPPEQCAMPRGWDRYQAWLAHERLARHEALTLARGAFPELNAFTGEELPVLWVTIPALPDGTHEDVSLTLTT